ncbi:hypothetical protein [Prochlorococcus sp. MIT 1011]|uniref:hypothetical protein n=1 Tax=Prochlorococcus sp. MIT 1011 TaxID=3082520 RepID=UPI0039B6CF59
MLRLNKFIYRKLYYFFNLKPNSKYSILTNSLKRNGFAILNKHDINCNHVLKECDSIIKEDNEGNIRLKNITNKDYIKTLINKDDLSKYPNIVKFALNKDLLSIVSSYLGHIPCLCYINIWKSPVSIKSEYKASGSQLWHIDHESFRQIKVFLYLNDVKEKSGPMEIFNRNYTKNQQLKLKYRLGEGKKHFSKGLDSKYSEKLIGNRGQIIFADTSSCFHRGSNKVQKARYILALQFLPVNAFSSNKFNQYRFLQEKGLVNSFTPLLHY